MDTPPVRGEGTGEDALSEVVMEALLITLIVLVGFAVVVDISLVRSRAAAETKTLHAALDIMADHLSALVTTADAAAILESAGWLVARDLEGKVIYVTADAARMMNSTPNALLGSTPESLKNIQAGTKMLAEFVHLVQLSGKTQPNIEISYDPPGGGSRLRLLCVVSPLRDRETGKIIGTVTILSAVDNYRTPW